MLQNPEECQKGNGRHKKVGSGKFLKGKKIILLKKKKLEKLKKGINRINICQILKREQVN